MERVGFARTSVFVDDYDEKHNYKHDAEGAVHARQYNLPVHVFSCALACRPTGRLALQMRNSSAHT